MTRKTILLIFSLIGITLILFAIALTSSTEQSSPFTKTAVTPSPVAQSTLFLSPNPVELTATKNGSIDVEINTGDNTVTGVQIEVGYDPQVLTNVKIQPGSFIQNPFVLLNTIDAKNGRISYALGLSPSQKPVTGTGTVATITFTQRPDAQGATTPITLLPKSLVTSPGVASSVLKASNNTTVKLYQPAVK